MIFAPDFRLSAVLDWEQASLGGPLRDLGWWLFFDELYSDGIGLPRLDGMGTREDTIALWESVSGIKAIDLYWYEIFAGFQLGILMLRRCNLQGRSTPGANGNNNLFTRQIARRLGWREPRDDF
jgi:aminoglycoside phosphotransferase (APT) family kinase protein